MNKGSYYILHAILMLARGLLTIMYLIFASMCSLNLQKLLWSSFKNCERKPISSYGDGNRENTDT